MAATTSQAKSRRKWTTEVPTRGGYCWYVSPDSKHPGLFQVIFRNCADPEIVSFGTDFKDRLCDLEPGGRWLGPIYHPRP